MAKKKQDKQEVVAGISYIPLLKARVDEVTEHVKNACSSALKAGLLLMKLHDNIVSRDTMSIEGHGVKGGGFQGVIDEIGLPKKTAYRWMNAAHNALNMLGWDAEVGELEVGGCDWEELEGRLTELGQGVSLNRLLLGASSEKGDIARLNEIIEKEEEDPGDETIQSVVERVESGEMKLIDAIRAIRGAEATKGQERAPVVYLAVNGRDGTLMGVLPKSLTSLRLGLEKWENLDEVARKEFARKWKEFALALPEELTK